MSRCRCGHLETDHRGDGGIFPTEPDTIAGGAQCRRCDCAGLHRTTYKKRISALRSAARTLRGYPLQPRLFAEDTVHQPQKRRDPPKAPASPETKRHD